MFRTRDFVLILVTVVFLLVSISATLVKNFSDKDSRESAVKLVDSKNTDYKAETVEVETLSREGKLADMRSKISASGELSIFSPAADFEEEGQSATGTKEITQEFVVQKCSDYSNLTSPWSPANVKFELSGGSRVVYRETKLATSSEISKTTLLQLTAYPVRQSTTQCISYDVIGVAQDGSLIRNNEVGLYGVFGDQTMIGYALDGYPIYGVSEETGDVCGGQTVGGQYGYYLSDDRESILDCFVARPTNFHGYSSN